MSPIFDCRDEAQLLTGMRQARAGTADAAIDRVQQGETLPSDQTMTRPQKRLKAPLDCVRWDLVGDDVC